MMKKLTTTALLMVLSTAAFSTELVLSINGRQETILKKVSKKRFEKISVVNSGEMSLDLVTSKGSTNLQKQEINPIDDGSKVAIEVTGKNVVKLEDQKEKINIEVEAIIDSTILGNVKSIKVSGKTLDAVYAESYKNAGLDVLKNLNIGNGAIKSNINSSEMNCVAEGDLLKCEQEQSLKFTISDK